MFNNIISKSKFTLALSLAIALFAVVGTELVDIKDITIAGLQKDLFISKPINNSFLSCMGGFDGN
jgi:hypothetical protein